LKSAAPRRRENYQLLSRHVWLYDENRLSSFRWTTDLLG